METLTQTKRELPYAWLNSHYMICNECNNVVTREESFAYHLRTVHKMDEETYWEKHLMTREDLKW